MARRHLTTLQTTSVFTLSQELDTLAVKYLNKELTEAVVNGIINKFLNENDLKIGDFKYRENYCYRNELIVKIRQEVGLPARRIAEYLRLTIGVVENRIWKFKKTLTVGISPK
jgi:hypothetical protein